MTNTPQQTPQQQGVRRAARVLALVLALLVTGLTGPISTMSTAYADAPDTWEDNAPVSPLHALLVLAVIPVGLFVLITLLVYLPSMSKAQAYQPGQAWRGEPTWFGGPRGGLEAAETASPAQLDSGDSESTRGGASGRW